jgi:cystathionine gamma-lyase
MKFGTKAIHAGQEPDPTTGAIMTPIYQTSTYVQDGPGGHKGYEYARTQNPTRTALEANLAALENGKFGFCFGSGMAATDAILKLLNPGDHVVSTSDLYGGTYRIFTKVFARYGLLFDFTPMKDASEVEALIKPSTKIIWVETPTNPMLNIIDIEAMASVAKKHKCLLVVDNTFASPCLQNPLDLGADIVMHSATKYIGGHSDLVMGAVITSNEKLAEDLKFIQNSCGAVPGPQDCFLALRGIKTLHLRLQRHCENAEVVARFLKNHPRVGKVYWPGFEDHPNHDVAKKQMRGFGGMVSFTLASDKLEDAVSLLKRSVLFACAESLGGVESLIGHPATMTHASIPKEERAKTGVTDTLIRLSVGVEDVEDLIDDLTNALNY